MGIRNTERNWGSVAKWLHWSIAVVMIAAIVCSVWADQLNPDIASHRALWQILIMKLHKPIGFTALLLILARCAWAVSGTRPRLPDNMSSREVLLSKSVHFGLYALMLLVPLSGWFMSQYSDSTINYFGLFEVQNIVQPDKARVGQLHPVHVYLGLFTLGAVIVHTLAALFHHYVRKDGVLSGMLPGAER